MLNEQIGQYRITGKLGQGGMGEIFSAYDQKLNRNVAVKFIASTHLDSDDSRKMFLREARAAAALDHPFICTVHDVMEHHGQPMIVMERVEGETLHERIGRGPLSVEQVVQHALEVAEALAAAHARGIVHRDIKTANVMLTPAGHVKVMDFGLAVITFSEPEEQTSHRSEDRPSKFAGTLPYMAPEILRGEPATESSDFYALGVVMYEMLTSRHPFTGKTDAVLISEILDRLPCTPRQLRADVPRAIDALVMRLLAKEPRKRPGASKVIAALRSTSGPKRSQPQQSLAVLPFRALTDDAESEYLGVALADATTSELALVRSLLVRPTAAILRYHDANDDPVLAAHDLRVDFIVAGTFQRAGSRLRVSAQLIDAAEERPIWSTKIDTTVDDIFAMQDEVSHKIVEALQLELTPADKQRIGRGPQAVARDAVDLYVKGRVALLAETIPSLNNAIEYFERATEIDRHNPLNWIGLADAYCRMAFNWDPEGGWYERAKEISERALQLDPQIPEGHYIRARLAWTPQGGYQHELAMREVVAALAERPNLFEGFDWLATILWHVGLIEDARLNYKRALAISPDDMLARMHVVSCELMNGNYEALQPGLEALEGLEASWAVYATAFWQLHIGDLAGAERTIEGGSRKFPAEVLFYSARAVLAAKKGDEAAALQAIERTMQNRKAYGHFHHAELEVACALAILGRKEESLDHLTSAVRSGFPSLSAVQNDPLLSSLRDEERYLELLSELRASQRYYQQFYDDVRGAVSSG